MGQYSILYKVSLDSFPAESKSLALLFLFQCYYLAFYKGAFVNVFSLNLMLIRVAHSHIEFREICTEPRGKSIRKHLPF